MYGGYLQVQTIILDCLHLILSQTLNSRALITNCHLGTMMQTQTVLIMALIILAVI